MKKFSLLFALLLGCCSAFASIHWENSGNGFWRQYEVGPYGWHYTGVCGVGAYPGSPSGFWEYPCIAPAFASLNSTPSITAQGLSYDLMQDVRKLSKIDGGIAVVDKWGKAAWYAPILEGCTYTDSFDGWMWTRSYYLNGSYCCASAWMWYQPEPPAIEGCTG